MTTQTQYQKYENRLASVEDSLGKLREDVAAITVEQKNIAQAILHLGSKLDEQSKKIQPNYGTWAAWLALIVMVIGGLMGTYINLTIWPLRDKITETQTILSSHITQGAHPKAQTRLNFLEKIADKQESILEEIIKMQTSNTIVNARQEAQIETLRECQKKHDG